MYDEDTAWISIEQRNRTEIVKLEMDATAGAARGRTSSILLLALLSFGTIVIMTVPSLSQNSKYKISFITVYIWETILLLSALVAMVMLIVFRKSNTHLKKDTHCDTSRKQYVTLCLSAIFGVSASILPFYESTQVSTCLDVPDKTQHLLQFVTYLCVGIYTVCQSVFGFLIHNHRCQSFVTRILIVVIISANASLFSNCVWDIFRSLNTQPSQDPFSSNSPDKNSSHVDYFKRTFVYSFCENGTEFIDHFSATRRIHKHTYPLLMEYLLFSVTILAPLWNIVIHTKTHPATINADIAITSDEPAEHVHDQTETQPLLSQTSSIHTYTLKEKLVCSLRSASCFVSRYSIIFSSVFAATVFVIHILVEIGYSECENNNKNSSNQVELEVSYYYLATIYMYIVSSVPFIGYFIARQQHNQTTWHSVVDTVLLILSATGLLVLVLFQTVDSITVLNNHPTSHLTKDVMYFIKLLFDYVGIYFQIKLILKAMSLQVGSESFPDQKIHIKGIIVFLGFCNIERWLADSFMPPTELWYANDIKGDDAFGHVSWWVIVQVLFPFLMFYRIWSALMCYKAYTMIL